MLAGNETRTINITEEQNKLIISYVHSNATESEKVFAQLLLLSFLSTRNGQLIRKKSNLPFTTPSKEVFKDIFVNMHQAFLAFDQTGKFSGFSIKHEDHKVVELNTENLSAIDDNQTPIAVIENLDNGELKDQLQAYLFKEVNQSSTLDGITDEIQTNNSSVNKAKNIPSILAVATIGNASKTIEAPSLTDFGQVTKNNEALDKVQTALKTQNTQQPLSKIISHHIQRLQPAREMQELMQKPETQANRLMSIGLNIAWFLSNGSRKVQKLYALENVLQYLKTNTDHTLEAALQHAETQPGNKLGKVKSTLFAGYFSQVARDLATQPKPTLESMMPKMGRSASAA